MCLVNFSELDRKRSPLLGPIETAVLFVRILLFVDR